MYIATVPNRNSNPTILLRESYRDEGKVKNRTLANLTCLPKSALNVLTRSLKGEKLVGADDLFEIAENGSPAHGHVKAALKAMTKLNFAKLISSRRTPQRDLVVAMVAARILQPQSKLATTLWWKDTTLPEALGIGDATEDDLYEAMDWLLERQEDIEKKLAKRHLQENGLALYDLTSSYFEGKTCPLAAFGHNRDGKKGKLQVNYGLLTNKQGIPVAVSVFNGNTGDPTTLMPQVEKLKEQFKLDKFVLVGDRGMLTQKQINNLKQIDGIDWVGALRPEAIKKIINRGSFQMGLFDERNLFELQHPDYEDERLIACRNEDLALRRALKRKKLISATTRELDKVRQMVLRKRLTGKEEIESRVNGVLNKYKIGKYFIVDVQENGFDYTLNEKKLIRAIEEKCNGKKELFKKRLKRADCHIESIAGKLSKINQMTKRGQLYGKDKIGVRVGKVVNKYKVAKHFKLKIRDNDFTFEVDQDKVQEEAALDGIYFVRTSLSQDHMDADEAVRSYKQLSKVEQAFRSFKSIDIMVRPIRHRVEERVKAHIFLCTLAYYVQWHMMEAWRLLLYADDEQEIKATRDPVSPAKRSSSALKKIRTKKLQDGETAYSFHGLLSHLGAIVRATCCCLDDQNPASIFQMDTRPNKTQQKAYDLLNTIHL